MEFVDLEEQQIYSEDAATIIQKQIRKRILRRIRKVYFKMDGNHDSESMLNIKDSSPVGDDDDNDKMKRTNKEEENQLQSKSDDEESARTDETENEEEKEVAVFQIARLMKTFHISWNKETPENDVIAKNIQILSGGALQLNLEKADELELMDPLYKEKPKTNQPKSGSRGKTQNRRRK